MRHASLVFFSLSTIAFTVGCGKSSDDTESTDTSTGTTETDTGTTDTDTDTDTGTTDTGTTDTDTGTLIVDTDGDGVEFADDCDDSDASLGAIADDADCDGAVTADDCDDNDASLNLDDLDGDNYSTCDGDCDDDAADKNPSGSDGLLTDGDCDGVVSGGALALSDYSFVGENSSDYAGWSVASAGDVDGDGLDDLLVGAYYNNDGGTWAGKAYLMLGSSLTNTSEIDLSSADYSFIGEGAYEFSAYSVSSAGDVDGDTLDDILVGAMCNNDAGSCAGKAYLILGASLGSTSQIDLSMADYSFTGENSGDYAGVSVSSAGDVDGDSLDDILVGAYGNDDGASESGKVYLVLASSLVNTPQINFSLADADYSFLGEASNNYLGFSASGAGDVDGDGLGDIVMGSSYYNSGVGRAYLVLGRSLISQSEIDLSMADYSFTGENALDYAGLSVSSAGDVDGDSLDDLIFGAYGNDDGGRSAGKAYIILASSLGSTSDISLSQADYGLVGENAEDLSGYSVSSAGDVDGDGLGDLIVGAHQESATDAGRVYLVLGSSLGTAPNTIDLSAADYSFTGDGPSDYAGYSVSSAGDVDGNGLDDVIVGGYGYDDGGIDAGKAFLILSGL